jgi:hypothetical protein
MEKEKSDVKMYHYESDPITEQEFGIFDTVKPCCWVGDSKSAIIYEQEDFARAAATILNQRTNHATRYRAKKFERNPKVNTGTFNCQKTTLQAIREIERKIR